MSDKQDFSKSIVSGYEIEAEILKKQDSNAKEFYKFGFKTLDPYFKLAKGFPIYLGAYDSHGKSEFIFELQMQLAELYGMKHLVFSGEVGSVEDIYFKLYWKYGRKPYTKYDKEGNQRPIYQNDEERLASRQFVNDHFIVIDRFTIDKGFTFGKMTEALDDYLRNGEFLDKVDTISVDSWYELDREEGDATDRQLELFLQKVFRYGYKHKITHIISSHIGATNHTTMLEIPDTKQKYPKVPTKYAWSGGMMWSRMSFQLVNGYKPHDKIDYFGDGELCAWNEFWVDVEKSKPESVGKKGRVTIYFDAFVTNRYYELIDGEKNFSRKWWEEESAIQPNLEFEKPPF